MANPRDYFGMLRWNYYARSKKLRQKMRLELLERAISLQNEEISQTLGQALGYYPWYCDDQKNFPGATKDDGVCVGEHVAETLAEEAADVIRQQRQEIADLKEQLLWASVHSGN